VFEAAADLHIEKGMNPDATTAAIETAIRGAPKPSGAHFVGAPDRMQTRLRNDRAACATASADARTARRRPRRRKIEAARSSAASSCGDGASCDDGLAHVRRRRQAGHERGVRPIAAVMREDRCHDGDGEHAAMIFLKAVETRVDMQPRLLDVQRLRLLRSVSRQVGDTCVVQAETLRSCREDEGTQAASEPRVRGGLACETGT
jgi:hypothetical protein